VLETQGGGCGFRHAIVTGMERAFKAEEFVERLNRGAFDGRLHEVLHKLTFEQLEQVAILMAKRLKGEATGRLNGTIGPIPDTSSGTDQNIE
jgi:hypothetical protein